MKFAFTMPHTMELKALTQPWEFSVTGADQTVMAKRAEELGYDMLAVPEHFVVPHTHVGLSGPHYFHSTVAQAYLAGATRSIPVNSAVTLLPVQHPVIMAKALATADWMSSGRIMCTFGIGWDEEEFRILGVPFHERGCMADEYLAAIIELWTSEAPSFDGRYVSFGNVAFAPKPVQKPHPPIWIGANADPAIRRAARLGDCWYVNPHNRIDTIVRQVDVYKRALDEYGKPFPAEFPARREVFVARSRSEAIRLCAPFLSAKYKAYDEWGQGRAMPAGDNDLGVEFDELIRDRFLIGSPDEVAEQMLALERATGINHLIMSVQWPGMPQRMALDQLHMLAEEVFPKVRAATRNTRA